MSEDFIRDDTGTPTPPDASDADSEPSPGKEPIKMLLIGSPRVVKNTIVNLYKRGFAEVNAWSRLLPTGNPGEVMSILRRDISIS